MALTIIFGSEVHLIWIFQLQLVNEELRLVENLGQEDEVKEIPFSLGIL